MCVWWWGGGLERGQQSTLNVCAYAHSILVAVFSQKGKAGQFQHQLHSAAPINGIQHPLPIQHDPGNYCNKRQLLIAQDRDGCTIKILLMGQF